LDDIFKIMVRHLHTDDPVKLFKLRGKIHLGMYRRRLNHGNQLPIGQCPMNLYARHKPGLLRNPGFPAWSATYYHP
jgi:hypothetical protein